MSIATGCGCCGCSACEVQPRRLVISVEAATGSGEVVGADDEFGSWSAVQTNCQPMLGVAGIASVTMDSQGSGYTSAPTPAVSSGDAVLAAEVVSYLESVSVTNGGSGYTQNLTGTVPLQALEVSQPASVLGIVRGGGTSVFLTSGGSGYTSAPVVSAAEGSGLQATSVMSGYYASLQVTAGGDGYTSVPTVSFGGSPTSSASATAQVRQFVESIEVTNGGSGYTSAPTVSVSGAGGGVVAVAQVSGGVVTAIDVLNKGFGQIKFSAPFPALTVTITGGGGGGATATATPFRPVTAVTLFSGGAGYTASDTVSFSGGGGSGASLTGTLLYRVASVTIQAGGSGYRVNAPLTFAGGGGSGASGLLLVSGSLDHVVVTTCGVFRNRRRSDGQTSLWSLDWPSSVSWSGGGGGTGATVSLSFHPTGVHRTFPVEAGEYTAAPQVTFSGGGGTGASATAYLSWQQTHEVGVEFLDDAPPRGFRAGGCAVTAGSIFCAGTSSEQYPLEPISSETICRRPPVELTNEEEGFSGVRYGESLAWAATAKTSSDSSSIASYPYTTPDLPATVLAGEGVYVWYYTMWEWLARFRVLEQAMWIKPLFSRVTPTNAWTISGQTTQTNAVLTPSFRQLESEAFQPIWYLESLSVTAPGSNLLTLPGQSQVTVRPEANGNAVRFSDEGVSASATFSYSPPVPNSFAGPAFSTPPTFAATFSPGATPGDYTLTSVSVSSAGAGGSNGNPTFVISDLSVGYFPQGYGYSPPSFSATVVGGEVQSVSITNAGLVRGGASVASITLPSEEVPSANRLLVGASGFLVSTAYSQPTVTASVSSGGASFSLTLAEEEDENGNPYWRISAVTIEGGGSGYSTPVALDFEVAGAAGVESIPAVVVASPPSRSQPTLEVAGAGQFSVSYTQSGEVWSVDQITVVEGGSGYQYGQEVSFTLGEDDTQDQAASAFIYTTLTEPAVTAQVSSGSGAELTVTLQSGYSGWEIASVAVVAGGTGYTDGEEVVFSGGDQEESYAYAVISVDGNGTITSVSVFSGGEFYDDDGIAASVQVQSGGGYYKQETFLDSISLVSGGRYYNKTITETSTPLSSPLVCNQAVSEGNGWQLLRYKPRPEAVGTLSPGEVRDIAVGDQVLVEGIQTITEQNSLGLSNDPSVFLDLSFTRRCGLPSLSFRFEE
jgi:hypothetical protein